MKITLIGPVYPYRGGIAHFTTLMANEFIKAGHTVQVISFKRQYPPWLYPGKSDKDTSPGRVKVDAEYILTPLNPLTWRKTVKKIIKFAPDQIVIPWWVTYWGPAFRHIFSRLKKKHLNTSILIHNTLPHEPHFWDRTITYHTLHLSDHFIVMTEKERTRLLNLLPEAKHIDVVSLPIIQVFKATGESRISLRHKMGLPTNAPILLFFGFVRPYKGLQTLIHALAILINKHGSDAHLLIAGEFWGNPNDYISLIETLGLQKHVHIHNTYIPDNAVGEYFKVADLFVAPYINGTQSAALKSALGSGLPAVVTEVIADQLVMALPMRCKVVPANDPEALAAGIKIQLSVPVLNPSELENLAQQSWKNLIEIVCRKDT